MPSSARDALEGFVAGRIAAEELVIAVATAYYGDGRGRHREPLRPLVEVIERAAPGVVELASVEAGPGFQIRLAERSFPKHHEADLRRAALACLASGAELPRLILASASPPVRTSEPTGDSREPGLVTRFVAAVRRLFTASA